MYIVTFLLCLRCLLQIVLGVLMFFFYLVLPKLSSSAHFILLAPLPPLVDRAPPPAPAPPAPPCLPGDAMATGCTAGPQRQLQR